jgi:hypothetical protein
VNDGIIKEINMARKRVSGWFFITNNPYLKIKNRVIILYYYFSVARNFE